MEERIRFKPSLGKPPGLFGIPSRFIVPWGSILVGCWGIYALSQYVVVLDPIVFVLLALALILSHWVLYGDRPWEFGGKFHHPESVAIGGAAFRFGDAQIKKKVGTRRVGKAANQRTLRAFEDLLDLAAIVRFDLKGENAAAFLLQNSRSQLRLIFAFDCQGFRSTLSVTEANQICKQIEDGLKDLPYGEELTVNAGTFSSAQARLRELTDLQVQLIATATHCSAETVRGNLEAYATELGAAPAANLYFMLAWAKDRVAALTRRGKHNPKYVRIYLSYTLTGGTQKSRDVIEKLLSQSEQLFSTYLGSPQHSDHWNHLEAALTNAFNQGYYQCLDFLQVKLGLTVRALTDTEIWKIEYLRYHAVSSQAEIPPIPQVLVLGKAGMEVIQNSSLHITSELFLDGCPVLDKTWVELPGIHRYVGGAVWNRKPTKEWRGTGIGREQLVYGSNILQVPDVVDSEIVVQFSAADQRRVLIDSQEQVKDANNHANMAAKRGRLDVGAHFNTRKGIEAQEALLDGGHAIRFAWVGLVYRRNPDALNKAMDKFCAQFTGDVVGREREYFDQIWLETLPYTWSQLLVHPYDRRHLDTTEVVRAMMPLLLDRSESQRGLELITPSGQTPIYLDLFSTHKNIIILGKKGSGKSLTAGELITYAQANQFQVVVVDATRGTGSGSFDELAKFYGAAYFNTVKESGNILERPDYRRFADDPDVLQDIQKAYRKLVMGALLVLLSDREDDSRRLRRMNQVLTLTVDAFLADPAINDRFERAHAGGFGSADWLAMPTLHDFAPFVTEHYFKPEEITDAIREEIATLKLQLRSILSPGNPLGQALASPSTFRSDATLMVYALGGVESEDEARVYGYAAYAAALVRSWRHPQTLFIMDECSYLLNFDSFAELAANVVAVVGRKSGIRTAILGQDIHAVRRCKTSRSILDNIDIFLVGHINEGAISDLEQEGIPRALLEENVSRSFLPDATEACSTWLYKESETLLFGRYYPSFAHIAAMMNEPTQVAMKQAYLAQCPDPKAAYARLADTLRSQTKDAL